MSTKPKNTDVLDAAMRYVAFGLKEGGAASTYAENVTIPDKPELCQGAVDKIRQIINDYNLEYHVISEVRRGNQNYIEFQISIKL